MAPALPQEIWAIIVRHTLEEDIFPRVSTNPLLVTCSLTHTIVEAESGIWEDIHLFRDVSFGLFREYFSKHGRASYLKFLTNDIHPPGQFPFCVENANQLSTPRLVGVLNKILTQKIHEAFDALHALETLPGPENRLRRGLHFEVRAAPYLRWCLWGTWRLQLLPSLANLPSLYSIESFSLGGGICSHERLARNPYPECINPASLMKLLPSFPNLRRLEAPYLHDDSSAEHFFNQDDFRALHETVFAGPRRDCRHEFAEQTLSGIASSLLPSTLTSIILNFGHPVSGRPTDQFASRPNLVEPFAYDPLSNCIRLLSQYCTSLRELELTGSFDQSLFVRPDNWPLQTSDGWPQLERLRITLLPDAPDGTWYFQGLAARPDDTPPFAVGKGDYPFLSEYPSGGRNNSSTKRTVYPNSFRMLPKNEKLEPFLEAWANGMSRMPRLWLASLFCPLRQVAEDDFSFVSSSHEVHDSAWGVSWASSESKSKATWWTDRWRPSQTLCQSLSKVWRHEGKRYEEVYRNGLSELDYADERDVTWPDEFSEFSLEL